LARPAEVPVDIERGQSSDWHDVVTIRIGRVIVHRCIRCGDGRWR
jgi:hypothetical protein